MDQQLTTNQWQKTQLEESECRSSPCIPRSNTESPWATSVPAIDEVELVDGRLRRKAPTQPQQPPNVLVAPPKGSPPKRTPKQFSVSNQHLAQARNTQNGSSYTQLHRSNQAPDNSSPAVPSLEAGGSSISESIDYAGGQGRYPRTTTASTLGSSAEVILKTVDETKREKARKERWPKPRKPPSVIANNASVYEQAACEVPSNETDCGAGIGLRREGRMDQGTRWEAPNSFAVTTWEGRSHFSDENFQERIVEWLPNAEEAAEQGTIRLRSIPTSTTEQAVEIAPRAWYPLDIDGEPTDDWWTEHLKNPLVVDHAKPWWTRYRNPVANYLLTLEPPDAPLDPTDNEINKVKAQTSQSTLERCVKHAQAKHTKFVKGPSKDEERQRKMANVLNNIGYVPTYSEFSPRLNIFIRPAEEKDIGEIREIYSHYIKNSIACPEMEPLDSRAIRARIEDIEEAKLPFLVAVDRAGRPIQMSRRGRRKPPKKETIVGFAFADDYNDMRGMCRYTVEVELFVDPAFVRYGVGRCLLDKIIHVLDSGYNACGGYEFITDSMGYSAGGRRSVACIIIHVPYSRQTTKELEWTKEWLEGFGFEQSGDLKDIGRKQSQAVSLATFSRQTMVTVDEHAV